MSAADTPGGEMRDYRQLWQSAVTATAAMHATARARPPQPKPKRWLYLLAVVALVAWTFDAMYQPGGEHTLPAEVVGIWRTSARSHANRRFELRERSLVFQVDSVASVITTHSIARVRQVQTRDGARFSVDYFEDGEAGPLLTFAFILRAAGRPEIVFPEQKRIVWTRVPGGEAAIR